jgi:hypothetical protein
MCVIMELPEILPGMIGMAYALNGCSLNQKNSEFWRTSDPNVFKMFC